MFMVVIFSLGTYKTDIWVPKQLSVYTQECAVYKISWGGWAGGILSTLKIKQKGFCPKKGFCPSWKIYRKDSVHLVKMSGRDYIHVAKNMEGLCPPIQKWAEGIMSRRDFVLHSDKTPPPSPWVDKPTIFHREEYSPFLAQLRHSVS